MKTRTIISAILSLIVMVLVPVLTVTTILATEALGLIFIYTMALNPIVSIIIGILSGWDKKTLWYIPLGNAVIYLVASIFITGFDVSLVAFAAVYFVLGALLAYITKLIKTRKA